MSHIAVKLKARAWLPVFLFVVFISPADTGVVDALRTALPVHWEYTGQSQTRYGQTPDSLTPAILPVFFDVVFPQNSPIVAK